MAFPDGFLWGASTAAYQIEGGNEASAFFDWERRKGWEPCGAAADSWRLWREDLACLRKINARAYRFSVEWSRVEPEPGRVDEEALNRYAEMAGALADAGIRPIVCLHHFSEPAWLFKLVPRGWMSPEAPRLFLGFVERVVGALQDRVSDWVTFNEPMVWLIMGYGLGHFPPGKFRLPVLERTFREGGLFDNLLAAHGGAYRLIREAVPEARVGIAQNIVDLEPAEPGLAHLTALRAWDRFMHARALDMAAERGLLDFIGLNYYTRVLVRASRLPFVPFGAVPGYAEAEEALGPLLFRLVGGRRGGRARTDMGWEVHPEGLGRVALRLWKDYDLPILVTENGIADSTGGRREAFIRDHLASLERAIDAGAVVRGYLHWSLIDNYEWGSYKPKFGLFRVDRNSNFRRTPAPGCALYAEISRTNRLP